MERERHAEMIENLDRMSDAGSLQKNNVFLFAHCNATMELADELLKRGIKPTAILDNNSDKYGMEYKGIAVSEPASILSTENAIVLIVSRFYEQMSAQLRSIGFDGDIVKMTDYNTYAEYSLSADTLLRKSERVKRGIERVRKLKEEYPGHFVVLCPFPALGDIYFCMSYLKAYMQINGYEKSLVCVVGGAQKQVADLFGYADVLEYRQKEIDEMIQAVIYKDYPDCFIAHQDRPYVVYLHRALYKKCIPLETVYKCGIFGLPQDTVAMQPTRWNEYSFEQSIQGGRTAIIAPYAKSVAALPGDLWESLIADLKSNGYQVFTNIIGDEKPLEGTEGISPKISEMKSAVEQAGLFIGIRSGMCDVIKTAEYRKIALYPDYFYCDTKWKAIDMYAIDGFENIVVKDGDTWEQIKKQIAW